MKKAICVLALSLASVSAFAATPKSFVKASTGVTDDGQKYSIHRVTCSNKKEATLTYWNATKQYCIGEVASDECKKKKMKIAKTACNK